MKIQIILLGILSIGLSCTLQAQQLTVATYNIRYSIKENYKRDSANGEDWVSRGPAVAALIRFHDFEIFALNN